MKPVNPEAFEFLLSQIKDGFVFERFAQDLLCEIIGIDFVPLGGVHDRGIDGLDHTFTQKSEPSTVYQISIQDDVRSKLKKTFKALAKNKIVCNRLIYVTSGLVDDKDIIIEELYKEYKTSVIIRDSQWLRGNINHSEGTLRIYTDFVERYTHQFNRPGEELIVSDFVRDPRIFVFLRQQLDSFGADEKLNELLVDSLILYALEGTDPDKGIYKTKENIWASIKEVTSFEVKKIDHLLDARLDILSTKPRRIRFHKQQNNYCLPFETRLELEEKKLQDKLLFDSFKKTTSDRLKRHLSEKGLHLKAVDHILALTLCEIFKRQGLDFANFMDKGEMPTTLENEMDNMISAAMEKAGIATPNRPIVGLAVFETIRELLYQGSKDELEYLRRLSKTYLMLFLLKCDPKVCSFFDSLASGLRVFVCNSLIIPALSEIQLPIQNRRHWNLLKSASKANVNLIINSAILSELVNHIQYVRRAYQDKYNGLESHYSDQSILRYVPEIIIRAYLYARAQGVRDTFDDFLNHFVTPNQNIETMEQELRIFLNDELGIQYMEDDALGIKLDEVEVDKLSSELKLLKKTENQAFFDAQTILTVYALRRKYNEAGSNEGFGYKTWWLSKDTTTYKAVMNCYKNDHHVSCYLRPDFLLNFVTLSANQRQANRVFDSMFPTLVGLSISHHVTSEVCEAVNQAISNHKGLSPARVRATIGSMTTKLMTHELQQKSKQLKHFLDTELD